MRKFWLLISSLFMISSFAIAAETASRIWDFGLVNKGAVLEHNFVFKNETGKVLNIKDTRTSCGCTGSKVEKKVLRPGETTAVEVQFNSKGYSGEIKQYVYLETDNLDNPVIKFIIKATVVK